MSKLGINAQRASDLARLLKTTRIKVAELRVGDVIWKDCLWVITGVKHLEDGMCVLEEADGNDHTCGRTTEVVILDRSILKNSMKEST
jgi:hypothetical protein